MSSVRFSSDLAIIVGTDPIYFRDHGIMFASALHISAATVNKMARFARGIISAGLSAERAIELGLHPMANAHPRCGMPHYLASVEATKCSETGISAAERALTLHALADPRSVAGDLLSPGHVMPCVVSAAAPTDILLRSAGNILRANGPSHVIAWTEILDEAGERASIEYCRSIAHDLGIDVYGLSATGKLHVEDAGSGRTSSLAALNIPSQEPPPPLCPVVGLGGAHKQFAMQGAGQ